MSDSESYLDIRARIPQLDVWMYCLESESEKRTHFEAGTNVAEWMAEEIDKNGYFSVTSTGNITGKRVTLIYSRERIPIEMRRMWKLIGSVDSKELVDMNSDIGSTDPITK